MSYFPRQKRQARSYWAELGFLVLGLFALQPNMLTNILSGSHSRSQSHVERQYYSPTQHALVPISQSWMANSVGANYLPSYQTPSISLMQSWNPQNANYNALPQNSFAPTLANGQLPPAYMTGQSSFPNGTQHPDYYVNSWGSQTAQQLPPTGLGYQPTSLYGQTTGNTSAYGVLPQQSDWRNYADSNLTKGLNPSSSYAGYASNPFNSLIAKPTQSSFLSPRGVNNYGPENYLSGRTNSPSTYYPYPANSTGTSSFTPYRPGNSFSR